MKNRDIAAIFDGLAELLELKGENPFKVRAYRNVAAAITELTVEASELMAQGRLREIPGVGEAIEKKITEILTTGKLGLYDKVKSEVPEGAVEMRAIPGVGPKTAMLLATELGVRNTEELEQAIVSGRVARLPGMGEKSAHKILQKLRAGKDGHRG